MELRLAPTPRDTLLRDGSAQLYRFRRPGGDAPRAPGALPVLLVPSLINRWYVLDLREGASLVQGLLAAGLDVYCLDWGVPEDEDRYLGWDDVLARLARAARHVQRRAGAERLSVVGYCMGATLAGIHAALHPEATGALVNLLGPFDFKCAGFLAAMTDPRWFDVDAMVEAGNISAAQMQSGFQALRPTGSIAKWMGFLHRTLPDPAAREGFMALETWATDNIPFPAAAYATYIKDLYQDNALIEGRHHVAGRRVDLGAVRCPVLNIVADRDAICPPPAALALAERAGATVKDVLRIPGGHVGAVVGERAGRELYPRLGAWLAERTAPLPQPRAMA